MRQLASILAVILLCLAASRPMQAQTVTGVRNINFGSFYRGGSATINANTAAAAEFTVTGRQGRRIRLTVTSTNLTKTGATLTLTLTNANCMFSLDAGVTWTAFSTGTLFHDTVMPNGTGNGSDGTIIVRVGGSLTAGATQADGVYNGTITVTGTFL